MNKIIGKVLFIYIYNIYIYIWHGINELATDVCAKKHNYYHGYYK